MAIYGPASRGGGGGGLGRIIGLWDLFRKGGGLDQNKFAFEQAKVEAAQRAKEAGQRNELVGAGQTVSGLSLPDLDAGTAAGLEPMSTRPWGQLNPEEQAHVVSFADRSTDPWGNIPAAYDAARDSRTDSALKKLQTDQAGTVLAGQKLELASKQKEIDRSDALRRAGQATPPQIPGNLPLIPSELINQISALASNSLHTTPFSGLPQGAQNEATGAFPQLTAPEVSEAWDKSAGALTGGQRGLAVTQSGAGGSVYEPASAIAAKVRLAMGAKQTEIVNGMLKDFRNEKSVQNYYGALQSLTSMRSQVEASAKDPTGSNDISLLTAFMRSIDPGSTVREGEFATASNSGGAPASIIAFYNKLVGAGRLSQQQRNQLLETANRNMASHEAAFGVVQQQYAKDADKLGLDPSYFAPSEKSSPATPGPTPAAAGQKFASDADAKAANLPAGTEYLVRVGNKGFEKRKAGEAAPTPAAPTLPQVGGAAPVTPPAGSLRSRMADARKEAAALPQVAADPLTGYISGIKNALEAVASPLRDLGHQAAAPVRDLGNQAGGAAHRAVDAMLAPTPPVPREGPQMFPGQMAPGALPDLSPTEQLHFNNQLRQLSATLPLEEARRQATENIRLIRQLRLPPDIQPLGPIPAPQRGPVFQQR
jgi:hypothetical protein